MTPSNSRRIFLMQMAATGPALALASRAQAQAAAPKVDEKDPQAMALGYVADTTKANQAKFPKHANDQHCGGCQLFQGKPADAFAMCPIFAGRQVAGKGWCSSYIKKTA